MRQIAFDEYYLTEQDESTVRVQLGGETGENAGPRSVARERVVRIRRRLQTIRRVLGLHR